MKGDEPTPKSEYIRWYTELMENATQYTAEIWPAHTTVETEFPPPCDVMHDVQMWGVFSIGNVLPRPPKWIPVSLMQPDEVGEYTVTINTHAGLHVRSSRFNGKWWTGEFGRKRIVLAWLRRPAPYIPEQSKGEGCSS